MSLNQSFILISQNIHADLKGPKVKYKLHYGWCTGRRFTAATRQTFCLYIVLKNLASLSHNKAVGMKYFFVMPAWGFLYMLMNRFQRISFVSVEVLFWMWFLLNLFSLIFFMFISFPAILFVHSSVNEKCSGGKSALGILHSDFQ